MKISLEIKYKANNAIHRTALFKFERPFLTSA